MVKMGGLSYLPGNNNSQLLLTGLTALYLSKRKLIISFAIIIL